MKKFKLKVPKYSFDHEGMIIRGEQQESSHTVYASAGNLCDDNMDIMSKANIRQCMVNGNNFAWRYELDKLESLEPIKLTRLDYEGCKVPFSLDDLEPYEEILISHNTKVGIVYVLSIILIISAFMWAMDLCYNVNLFLPLFVTILFTLIVIIATCLALCELEL